MSRPALTGRKMNAEEADPAGGASADFRVRVGDGNLALRAVAMTTTVAVMAKATAVVDGNAA